MAPGLVFPDASAQGSGGAVSRHSAGAGPAGVGAPLWLWALSISKERLFRSVLQLGRYNLLLPCSGDRDAEAMRESSW